MKRLFFVAFLMMIALPLAIGNATPSKVAQFVDPDPVGIAAFQK